jgi:hypothetical protein
VFRSVFVPATREGSRGRYLLVSICCLARGVTLRDAAVVVVVDSSPQQRLQPPLPTTRNGGGEHVLETLNPHPHNGMDSAGKEVFGLGSAAEVQL